jgi:hypothetical protein
VRQVQSPLPREAVDGIERTNRIRFELFGLVSLLTVKERKALWKKFPAISSLAALRTTQVLTARNSSPSTGIQVIRENEFR